MDPLETAKQFFDACELQVLGWEGCRRYVADGATFHSAAASYASIHTIEAYCEQIAAAFRTTFAGSTGHVHAAAYDAEHRTVLLYGDSCAQHTGAGGPVPPTHRQAVIPFVFALRMDAAGKIEHLEKIYDEASGRRQLGWPHEVTAPAAQAQVPA